MRISGSTAIAHSRLKRRLSGLYFAAFFQNFVLWYAIEKLFMKNIGFSNAGIALATIIFTAITLAVNIPFGLLADRWSRRGVLVLASIFLMVSSLICGLSHQPLTYIIGISFWGLFLGCYSGIYDSVIYDVLLEETGKSEGYEHYYGRFALFSTAALIVSSLLSGVFGRLLSPRADFFLSLPIILASIVALVYFKEPKLHKHNANLQIIGHVKEIRQAILRRGPVLWLVFSMIFLSIGMRLTLEFGPLWFVALALPVLFYGPAVALLQAGIGLSSFVSDKIYKSRRLIMAAALVTLIIGLVLTFRKVIFVAIALSLIVSGTMALTIILSRRLHDAMPSSIRVGASSLVSTIGYVVFLPIAYEFGRLSDRYTVFTAAWLVIGVIFVALTGLSVYMVKQN